MRLRLSGWCEAGGQPRIATSYDSPDALRWQRFIGACRITGSKRCPPYSDDRRTNGGREVSGEQRRQDGVVDNVPGVRRSRRKRAAAVKPVGLLIIVENKAEVNSMEGTHESSFITLDS